LLFDIFMLFLSLALILFSCVLFTNSIEWFGKKLNLSQGVVGSILAAIGTAMPETIIPIIAIIFYGGGEAGQIATGAILGAPFMLSTLGLFVIGTAVIIYSLTGKRTLKLNADKKTFKRDLNFFIIIYIIAIMTTFVNHYNQSRIIATIIILSLYVLYVIKTFSGEQQMCENLGSLYCSKLLNVENNMFWIVFQLILSLIGIIYGAHMFVGYVKDISYTFGIAPLLLSIIITPIATELPEKINSIVWIGQNKDTLALGNITGAMVFQSAIPVTIGILFTPWNITGIAFLSAVIALTSAFLNLAWINSGKKINPFIFILGGILYSIFLITIL